MKSVTLVNGTTKAGQPYQRWDYTLIDGKTYGNFDEQYAQQGLKQGDAVLILGEQKGKYFSMDAIIKDDEPPVLAVTDFLPVSQVLEKPAKATEYNLSIEQVRSNALDSAIKVTKKLGADDYVGDLMGHAVEFEKYILKGKII